jgi:hypothetical protein
MVKVNANEPILVSLVFHNILDCINPVATEKMSCEMDADVEKGK